MHLLRRPEMIMMIFAERLMPLPWSLLRFLKLRNFACLQFADKSEMLLSLWGLFLTSFLKMFRLSTTKLGSLPTFHMLSKLVGLFQIMLCISLFGTFFTHLRLGGVMPWRRLSVTLFLLFPPSLADALMKFGDHVDESFGAGSFRSVVSLRMSEFATPKPSADASLGKCVTPESSSEISLSEFATPEPSSLLLRKFICEVIQILCPLSKGTWILSHFHLVVWWLLVGLIIIVLMPPKDVVAAEDEGLVDVVRKVALLLVGAPLGRSVVVEAAVILLLISKVHLCTLMRLRKFRVVDPVFQRPYSPSSGYDFDEC
ncbi:hypothetical protein EJB05_50159, partial [Eragrostis curvula]